MKALIVDGYNVIYKTAYLRGILDRSLEEARNAVTELARAYQRQCGGIGKVCVVFDGKSELRNIASYRRPEQVFSKTGEGDSELIRVAKRLYRTHHVLVVSDDNFVRNNARAYGATVINIATFLAPLSKKAPHRKKKESSKRIDPETASEINEELKRHWNL